MSDENVTKMLSVLPKSHLERLHIALKCRFETNSDSLFRNRPKRFVTSLKHMNKDMYVVPVNFPLDMADLYVSALPLPTRESEPYVIMFEECSLNVTNVFQHSNTQVLCGLEHDTKERSNMQTKIETRYHALYSTPQFHASLSHEIYLYDSQCERYLESFCERYATTSARLRISRFIGCISDVFHQAHRFRAFIGLAQQFILHYLLRNHPHNK